MSPAGTPPNPAQPPGALFEVDTPEGRRPFIPPPNPEPPDTPSTQQPDNPDNPRGRPTLSLPQQATPLTSQQGTIPTEDLTGPQTDPALQTRILAQDGLTPDNPMNPRGTPDFIVGAPPPENSDSNSNSEQARGKENKPKPTP